MVMPNHATTTRPRVDLPDTAPSSFVQLWRWLVKHSWFLHAPKHVQVTLSGTEVYRVLEKATKPNVNRLELRKLFARGRRYFIRSDASHEGGFQMSLTQKVWWHPKRRTDATAILNARTDKLENGNTRLTLRGRIKLRYLLTQFFWPTFITSIIIYMDWAWWVILLCIVGLYGFSWTAQRLTAKLEAYEIIHYIETVLADYAPEPPPQLAPQQSPEITVDESFTAEWDKFVQRTQRD